LNWFANSVELEADRIVTVNVNTTDIESVHPPIFPPGTSKTITGGITTARKVRLSLLCCRFPTQHIAIDCQNEYFVPRVNTPTLDELGLKMSIPSQTTFGQSKQSQNWREERQYVIELPFSNDNTRSHDL